MVSSTSVRATLGIVCQLMNCLQYQKILFVEYHLSSSYVNSYFLNMVLKFLNETHSINWSIIFQIMHIQWNHHCSWGNQCLWLLRVTLVSIFINIIMIKLLVPKKLHHHKPRNFGYSQTPMNKNDSTDSKQFLPLQSSSCDGNLRFWI